MIKLIIKDGKIMAEGNEFYNGPDPWVEAPEDYVPGSYIMPLSLYKPDRVTRSSGVLALKRHYLEDGDLHEVPPTESREGGTLYDIVLAFRDSMAPGLDRDKVDIALTSTAYWIRYSVTVGLMAMVIPLTEEQLDTLFAWAYAEEDQF